MGQRNEPMRTAVERAIRAEKRDAVIATVLDFLVMGMVVIALLGLW